MEVFGYTELNAKLWALFLNGLVVILAVTLAVRVTPNWRLASFLMCLPCLRVGSAVHLVRNYGLLYALTLAIVLVWDVWRRNPRTRNLVYLAVLMIAAFYTSMLSLLILPALLVSNWLFAKRQVAFALAVGIALLSLIPWMLTIAPVYRSLKPGPTLSWNRTNPHIALLELPYDLLSGEDPGNSSLPYPFSGRNVRKVFAGPALLLNIALAFAVWRTQRINWRRKGLEDYRWTSICAMVAAAPCLALWLGSLLTSPILHGRYTLFITPFYWLLIVQGVFLGGTWGKAIFRAGFAPWIAASILVAFVHHVTASPVRKGTTELASRVHGDDLVLFDLNRNVGWQAYWEWTHRLDRFDYIATAGTNIAPQEASWCHSSVRVILAFPGMDKSFFSPTAGLARDTWKLS